LGKKIHKFSWIELIDIDAKLEQEFKKLEKAFESKLNCEDTNFG